MQATDKEAEIQGPLTAGRRHVVDRDWPPLYQRLHDVSLMALYVQPPPLHNTLHLLHHVAIDSPLLAISDYPGLLNPTVKAHLLASCDGADILGAPLPAQCRVNAPSSIVDVARSQPTAPGRVPYGRCQNALHSVERN